MRLNFSADRTPPLLLRACCRVSLQESVSALNATGRGKSSSALRAADQILLIAAELFERERLRKGRVALAVFLGRHAGLLAKEVRKVVGIVVADLKGNFKDPHGGVGEQLLGALDAQLRDVVHDAVTALAAEELADVGLRIVQVLGDVGQRQVLRVVAAQIVEDIGMTDVDLASSSARGGVSR